MELETLNKLYLELSQVATARTARELELQAELNRCQELVLWNGSQLLASELADNIIGDIRQQYSNALTRSDAAKIVSGGKPVAFRVRVYVEKIPDDR